jgi:hypothetical protein
MPTLKDITQAILKICGMSGVGTLIMINIHLPMQIGGNNNQQTNNSSAKNNPPEEGSISRKPKNELVFDNYNDPQK